MARAVVRVSQVGELPLDGVDAVNHRLGRVVDRADAGKILDDLAARGGGDGHQVEVLVAAVGNAIQRHQVSAQHVGSRLAGHGSGPAGWVAHGELVSVMNGAAGGPRIVMTPGGVGIVSPRRIRGIPLMVTPVLPSWPMGSG